MDDMGYYASPMTYGQNALVIMNFLMTDGVRPTSIKEFQNPQLEKLFSRQEACLWMAIALGDSKSVIIDEENEEKSEKQFFSNKQHDLTTPERNSATAPMSEGIDMEVRKTRESTKSVVKDANHTPTKRGMVLPFQPLSLAFEHVNYYVDMPAVRMKSQGIEADRLQLLRDASGAFRPGIQIALVGVSGAGKTTLMDVLAGRKTGGYIEGSISISGYPKNKQLSLVLVDTVSRMIYILQIFTPEGCFGWPSGIHGLSTEQRKRLTVAVELVANPSILFMDEPTTGLDARAAAVVMRTVRNTVDTGRTVVCTIHQPSIDIFEAFDELLLMKRGGQIIYAGALGRNSHKLVEYFEAVPGVPKVRDGQNPATWMLEISSAAVEAQLGVDLQKFMLNLNSISKRNQELIKELSTPSPGSKDLYFPTKYSQSFISQCKACFWKQHWSYWRNPPYNAIRFFLTIIIGVLFGVIFWNKGEKTDKEQDLINLLGAMFSAVFFLGATNTSSVQPVVAIERTVFYRERAAGMYSALPYAFAQVAIEAIYVAIQTLVYSLLLYSMMGFYWRVDKFLWFYYYLLMCFIYFTLYGMMIVALTPNHQIAAIVMSFFLSFWNLFAGFLIPRMQIPIWWRWYYWASPVSWTIYGLVTSQVGDKEDPVQVPGAGVKSVKLYLKEALGFEYDFLGAVALAHIGWVLLFLFVFAYGIKFLNFQRR
ncbi:Pleiotropic drug resistance protein 2 [Vitis vinifera]|uniref:Pleiotropic drug resistance protein 2 n=1 Tax=Vitis vinifera TaxID=29760 RepID=A0A438DF82_VITVI|nr:Pleiotropic drug resistance protein 2 [Vitis vinifera]